MPTKLQNIKGFRDFLPENAIQRAYVIDIFSKAFELYGFDRIETPALEYADLLLGKYGEEAEKLMYLFVDRGGRKVGLRYDQTVPTARVAAQYDLAKPIRRYQIQNVWRAENTQKGRYREFLQCDADIIGSSAPQADAEVLRLFWELYHALGFTTITLLFNSRQILKKMITEAYGKDVSDTLFFSIVSSLDKIDKVGFTGVQEELLRKGIASDIVTQLFNQVNEYRSYSLKDLQKLDNNLSQSIEIAVNDLGLPETAIKFEPTLARGLDYYTGLIFESVDEKTKGSLGGGGRYDQLIGNISGKDMPAVGFAIGFDRTLELANEYGLLPDEKTKTKILIVTIAESELVLVYARNVLNSLRTNQVATEMYLNPYDKIQKQFSYAEKKGIPFVVTIGPQEVETKTIQIKNIKSGLKETISLDLLIKKLHPFLKN